MSLPEKAFPVSWDQFHRDARALAWRLAAQDKKWKAMVVITRGGLVPAAIICRELGIRMKVLLQVNVASDDAKFGFTAAGVTEALPALLELPGIEIRGLMTIPPLEGDPQPHFAALRRLRDALATAAHPLPELSMGMSGDFTLAITEGATIVRVGSAIFGGR